MAAPGGPRALAFEPGGMFLYVANQGAGNVSAYSQDAITGALTSLGAQGPANGAFSIAVLRR